MANKMNVIHIGIILTTFTLVACSGLPWNENLQNTAAISNANTLVDGVASGAVTYGNARLSQFNMNGEGSVITVKPRQIIHVSSAYEYQCTTCRSELANQIIVGIAGRSAQACIYDGGQTGRGLVNFDLKAPAMPGQYDIRFKTLQVENCQVALATGWEENAAPSEATIGKITVQQKPKKEVTTILVDDKIKKSD